ncbi:unnamed protein product [Symbiodinium sp. CCMP2456]|nr:unnamed protein product [Symbiodinium sp. CCMP2456]
MLMRIMADLAAEFDPEQYDFGDITRIVVARHADACRSQAGKRKQVRAIIVKNRRREQIALHQEASRKRTLRVENLRDSMGVEAFSDMVQSQQWTRRNRAGGQSLSRSQLSQTYAWWWSEEGEAYRQGPPLPRGDLVMDTLLPCRSRLADPWQRVLHCLTRQTPVARAASEMDIVVCKEALPRLLARATDRIMAQQLPDLKFKSFVSATVDFARGEGERVPSVHIASKTGRPEELVLLDAASLDNLLPGDVVIPRRLLEVHGRILGTVGWEDVALALPRPHDMFDVQLRGRHPKSSKLAVAWDLTNRLDAAEMHVVWPGSPQELVVRLRGSTEGGLTLDDAANRLFAELDHHRSLSLPFLRLQRQRAQAWERRRDAVTNAVSRGLVQPGRRLLVAVFRALRRLARLLQDRVWDPCAGRLRQLAIRAWSMAEPTCRRCASTLRHALSRLHLAVRRLLCWTYRVTSETASGIGQWFMRRARAFAHRLQPYLTASQEAARRMGTRVHFALRAAWDSTEPLRSAGHRTLTRGWARLQEAVRRMGTRCRFALRAAWDSTEPLRSAGHRTLTRGWARLQGGVGSLGCWWASRPWPRRVASCVASRASASWEMMYQHALQPVGRSCCRLSAKVSFAAGKACKRLCPQRVRMARVRRHDERHTLF